MFHSNFGNIVNIMTGREGTQHPVAKNRFIQLLILFVNVMVGTSSFIQFTINAVHNFSNWLGQTLITGIFTAYPYVGRIIESYLL